VVVGGQVEAAGAVGVADLDAVREPTKAAGMKDKKVLVNPDVLRSMQASIRRRFPGAGQASPRIGFEGKRLEAVKAAVRVAADSVVRRPTKTAGE
jgi:hypothetical protein